MEKLQLNFNSDHSKLSNLDSWGQYTGPFNITLGQQTEKNLILQTFWKDDKISLQSVYLNIFSVSYKLIMEEGPFQSDHP